LKSLNRKQRSDLGKYRKITEQTKGSIEGLFLLKMVFLSTLQSDDYKADHQVEVSGST
jgi:hypothetical protein